MSASSILILQRKSEKDIVNTNRREQTRSTKKVQKNEKNLEEKTDKEIRTKQLNRN